MSNRLKGKKAIITGAARGIGLSIAERFLREGAEVILGDIDKNAATKAAEQIDPAGRCCKAFGADVSQPDDASALVDYALSAFGGLDCLVNNAGIAPNRLLRDQSIDEWNQVMAVNLTGSFLCSQAAIPALEMSEGGRIINISSVSGQRGATGRSAYGVSKAGIIQLTRELAVELAEANILVNAIAPGPVITDLTNNSTTTTQSYIERIPLRTFIDKESIAAAAVFLASEESNFTTGDTINVDGGFNAAGLIFPNNQL